jgi:predicted RNase H-like HicB family nuclease
MAHYIAVFVPERAGGWSVLFRDLPGCATQGKDLNEALENAADALAGHVAVARDFGDELPEPSALEEIRADKTWCTENAVDWGSAMAAPIAIRPPLGRPERVTISLDANVLRAIDGYAAKRNLTRSAALSAGAEILLGYRSPADMSFGTDGSTKKAAPGLREGVSRALSKGRTGRKVRTSGRRSSDS